MKTERFRTIYCPACSGVGSMWGAPCVACDGSGKTSILEREKRSRINWPRVVVWALFIFTLGWVFRAIAHR